MNRKNAKKWYSLLVLVSIIGLCGCNKNEEETEHVHAPIKIEGVSATCTTAGNTEYYVCEGCDKVFSDLACTQETTVIAQTIAPIAHTYDESVWGYKGQDGHAHVCACGAKEELLEHVSSGAATTENAEICTVCGFEIAPKAEPTQKPATGGGGFELPEDKFD